MSYIVWKGVNSSTIPGLLIQELPSISKPPMRYNTIDVDGRDGEIIQELGYGSYDKVLSIALTRGFDINQVIKYFSGSGNLVFSNESDKYYKAKILEQVDYERLLKFRTATVIFRVEPYKYKLSETETDVSITSQESVSVTNSGLEVSKPLITLYGSGEITFTLDSIDIFTINIGDDGSVVIDSDEENAYLGSVLKNRNMTGKFPVLQPGSNTITWTGSLTRIKVNPRSRWL